MRNASTPAALEALSGYAPLHQAAYSGAPIEVAQALISLGALRTLRTMDGQRAVDIARQEGHRHLVEILTPTPSLAFAPDKLTKVERGVHQVIRERQTIAPLLNRMAMRLPPLELLTETPENALWFPVPGMYGGFHLRIGQGGRRTDLRGGQLVADRQWLGGTPPGFHRRHAGTTPAVRRRRNDYQ